MTTRAACILLGLVAAGCASHADDTVAERELFRIAAAEVIDEPRSVRLTQPLGPPVPGYEIELRCTRADGATVGPSHLLTFPGRTGAIGVMSQFTFIQDFDVEADDRAFIADPIIGTLQEGWNIAVLVRPNEARDGVASLAYAVDAANVRRPIARREAGLLSPSHDLPVTIQVPKLGHGSARGALVVSLDETVEIARLADPSDGAEVVVSARVRRVLVPAQPTTAGQDGVDERAALESLVLAVDAAATTPSLRVSAVRLPPGVHDADAAGVAHLAAVTLHSALAPGVRISDRLVEPYLGDWEAKTFEGGVAFDPEIRTHDSGLSVEVASATEIVVSWRTTPRWEIFTLRPFSSVGVGSITNAPPAGPEDFELTIDQPQSLATERRITLVPGRSVHEVFRLADGGAAALVVEYEP